jgi:ketosteroid isomerase-like protein
MTMHGPNRTLLGVLLAVGALAGCSARQAPYGPAAAPAQAADSVSAHRAATRFLVAFDSLQFDAFRAQLADDVTMFFPFPQVPRRADGRAAVEQVFSQFMEAQRTARARDGRPMVQGLMPQVRDLRVQMVGADAAVASFHLGAESPARRSIVFRRTGTDAWQVVHWHASSAPAQPAGR